MAVSCYVFHKHIGHVLLIEVLPYACYYLVNVLTIQITFTSKAFYCVNIRSKFSYLHCFFRCESAVLSGFVLMFIASITWLKLVSFAHTNYDIRALSKSIEKV
jgi:hypothetical protein